MQCHIVCRSTARSRKASLRVALQVVPRSCFFGLNPLTTVFKRPRGRNAHSLGQPPGLTVCLPHLSQELLRSVAEGFGSPTACYPLGTKETCVCRPRSGLPSSSCVASSKTKSRQRQCLAHTPLTNIPGVVRSVSFLCFPQTNRHTCTYHHYYILDISDILFCLDQLYDINTGCHRPRVSALL